MNKIGVITFYTEHESMPYGDRVYPVLTGSYIYDVEQFPNLKNEDLIRAVDQFEEWYNDVWNDYWKQENGNTRANPEKLKEFANVVQGQYGYSDPESYLVHTYNLKKVDEFKSVKL